MNNSEVKKEYKQFRAVMDGLNWYNGNEILDYEIKDGIWLWENYIPKGEITGITGPSDTGKSTLLRQLAMAIASDSREFLGNGLHPRTGNTICVVTEDGAAGLKQSMEKQVAGLGINKEALNKVHFLLDDNNVFDKVERKLAGEEIDLLIVDAFSDTFEGNANDFVQVRAYMSKLKWLARKYGCSVILLHHNTKNSEKGAPDKNRLNGSQAIEAKMRSLFELRLGGNNDERLLTLLKGNYVPIEVKKQSKIVKFEGEHLLFSSTGEFKNNDVAKRLEGGKKYDKEFWVQQMWLLRDDDDFTFLGARDKLIAMYPDRQVPGKTWFVENC